MLKINNCFLKTLLLNLEKNFENFIYVFLGIKLCGAITKKNNTKNDNETQH